MLEHLADGRAKLYVIWRLLHLRKQHEELFKHGGYTAVRASGERGKHLIAFARRHDGRTLVTVAARMIAGLGIRQGQCPCGPELWGDARVDLPFLKDGTAVRDALSGREHVVGAGGLAVGEVLAAFPAAVLVAE
jgi:(1->4)-alpha-D-glucan 1-alpha-D-glucosylmutase